MISIRTEALPIIVAATLASTSAAQPIQYVETRKSDQADTIHGVRIADPYRWLEDDNSAETREWVKAQNAVTSGFMEALPQRAPTRKLFTDLYNFEKFGIPFKEGGRYFYTRNDGLQQQSVLYTVKKLSDAPQVAIDPNTLSKDGTVALTGTAVSRDGRFLAYGVSRAGSDWEEWMVRDLASGKDLADRIKWVKFSTGEWTPDGKGFFYSRFDEPKAGEAHTGSNYFQKVYFHRIGTDQSRDLLVYENKGNKDWGFSATVTDDGRHLLISVSKGTARESGLMWLPLKNGGYAAGQPKVLTLDFDAEYVVVGADRNTLWLKTDLDAPRGKIVVVDLGRPERKNWKTVVGEQKDALTAAGAVGGHLIAQYLQDAAGQVRVHGTNGKLVREVALPGVGSVGGFAGRYKQHETFFSYTSLTTPREIHRYDVNTGKTTLFKRPNTAFNADEFETRREFVTGKDGTRFPIFIAHRKGLTLDAGNATLLYGYGGFNVAETPTYRVTAATWLRMGGVYVTASIRGGGEYGSAWHAAGTKLSKQNVFDDFIAAGEWLIANKYTSPRKLAINGGSNGGL